MKVHYSEIVQYDPFSRFECFTASKGSNNYFNLSERRAVPSALSNVVVPELFGP